MRLFVANFVANFVELARGFGHSQRSWLRSCPEQTLSQTPLRFLLVALFLLLACPGSAVELLAPPAVTVTATNATIRWSTDTPSGSRAKISPSGPKVVASARQPAKEHVVNIVGLQAGARYVVTIGTARTWLATNTFVTAGSPEKTRPSAEPAVGGDLPPSQAPPTRETWGNLSTLADHFVRHGPDFQARDADDYARLAWEFLQRAKREGFPAKVDPAGTLRVFDPKTRSFAAYNPDSTTKTFFKPRSRDYFERQPGKRIDLKTWR
jgi:hypothetical protein